jgi:hypothetical protein
VRDATVPGMLLSSMARRCSLSRGLGFGSFGGMKARLVQMACLLCCVAAWAKVPRLQPYLQGPDNRLTKTAFTDGTSVSNIYTALDLAGHKRAGV